MVAASARPTDTWLMVDTRRCTYFQKGTNKRTKSNITLRPPNMPVLLSLRGNALCGINEERAEIST
jgi:hypothetical protein